MEVLARTIVIIGLIEMSFPLIMFMGMVFITGMESFVQVFDKNFRFKRFENFIDENQEKIFAIWAMLEIIGFIFLIIGATITGVIK